MKKATLSYGAALLLLFAGSSCSKEDPQDEHIRISESHLDVNYGETYPIQAEFNREGYNRSQFTWSSTNENIAKISQQGVVSGERRGEATITVKTNDELFSGSTHVTVHPTNMMFLEPILEFRQSRSFIRANETREFLEESEDLLIFEGENEDVLLLAYYFEQDLYEQSIVVFETTDATLEKAVDFMEQRYDYLGFYQGMHHLHDEHTYVLFFLDEELGLVAAYLEYDQSSAVNARLGSIKDKLKNIQPPKPYSGNHQIDPSRFK